MMGLSTMRRKKKDTISVIAQLLKIFVLSILSFWSSHEMLRSGVDPSAMKTIILRADMPAVAMSNASWK
jgi:hypothetical protein